MFAVSIWGIFRLILVEKTIDFVMTPFLWITWGMEGARESFTSFYPRLQSLLRSIEKSNILQSTIALIIDFQEAQCFLLMAIQIGVLVATNKADFHSQSTYFSLEENRIAAHDLASLGVALVCIIQLTLCRLKVDSIYTLLLSTFTVALAGATMKHGFSSQRMGEITSSLSGDMKVDECGEYGSLRFQCLGDTFFDGLSMNIDGLDRRRLAVSCSSLILVWAIKLCRELSNQSFLHYVKKRYQWQSAWAARLRLHVWVPVLADFTHFGFEAFLFYTVILSSAALFPHIGNKGYTKWESDDIYTSYVKPQEWNIGQILAILVWAPVLFKYVYALTRK